MRRVDITGIALEANTGAPLVVLREQDEPHRLLPIFIGGPEATAIALAAAGQKPPVPMVHDVMAAVVRSLDGSVSSVSVTDLQDGTYVATIELAGPSGNRRVGSRPSDALALAVRTGAPVFVAEAVLDVAGSLPAPDDDTDQTMSDQTTPEQPAIDPAAIEAEVDHFRSFLDDVDPSDFIDVDIADDPDGRADRPDTADDPDSG